MPAKFACALRAKLTAQHFKVGPVQAGPRENDQAGVPSVWFEYDDGKHFMRQAVALGDERAISLVLGTSSAEARSGQVRSFEQALRTLRPLSSEELGGSAGAPADAGVTDGATAVEAPPAPLSPVGPCTR